MSVHQHAISAHQENFTSGVTQHPKHTPLNIIKRTVPARQSD